MVRTWAFLMLASSLSWTSELASDEIPRELAQVDRRIGQQPKYVANQPLYGLIVIGPAMKTRVWIVLDKSETQQASYDVAYVDRNGNGDLTDAGERLTAETSEDGTTRFQLPDVTDVASKVTHTQFTLRCAAPPDPYQMVSVHWNGEDHPVRKFGGGYTSNPDLENYSTFASSPAEAPVLWLNGDGPFTFQRWYTEPLQIGGQTHVKLFIGVPGVGKSTFCAFQVHALPAGEGIEGVLHYTTSSGEKRQTPFALLDKC